MKRKIFGAIIFAAMLEISALAQEDDSTPYWPYPEQTQAAPQATTQPAKKAPAKKAPTKKTPAKKTTAKKPAPAKPSTLEQGIALLQQEKYTEAGKYLQRAVMENKNNANAWYWYGVYHEKIGGFHQAQYFYSKAVTLDPTIEQLSRVVFYPNDSEKTALWDPKRPARVLPVQTPALKGASSIPAGVSSFPTAPNDPQTPKVPVYVPPDAGASPLDGDTWAASVYVPPSATEAVNIASTNASTSTMGRQILQFSTSSTTTTTEISASGYKNEEAVFTPPAPEKKAAATTKTTTTKKTSSSTAAPKKQQTPARRVVKKSAAKTSTTTTTTRRVSADVRPAQPAPQRTQPAAPTPAPAPVQTERIEPMTPQFPEQQQIQADTQREYIPPVGQAVPDLGTINEAPIPPVGQDNL